MRAVLTVQTFFMKRLTSFLFVLVSTFSLYAQTVYQVGPTRTYTVPSQVIPLLNNGDIVEIDAGTYPGDVGVWTADNITIKGIGGMAHIPANGNNAQGKAIWVIQGDNYTLEYIELSDCAVPDNNGAGIRHEGDNLTLRYCYFHDNENGILTISNNPDSEVLIEYSEFARNFHDGGFAHNIYINRIKKFTLRYSYFHGVQIANNVKTRAAENHILYNRIMDESTNASYQIDFSNGGKVYLVGNLIQQGPNATNFSVIAYAKEGATYSDNELNMYNNTIVNERGNGYFLNSSSSNASTNIFNNFLVGAVTGLSTGPITINSSDNLHIPNPNNAELQDIDNYNYRLTDSSPAIDAGLNPASQSVTIIPTQQYVHTANTEPRPSDGPWDMGAYEYAVCPDSLLLTGTLTEDIYTAAQHIETSGTVLISNGARKSFTAGEDILFRPGFAVENGATFLAKISPCNSGDAAKMNKLPSFVSSPLKETDNYDLTFFPNPSFGHTQFQLGVNTFDYYEIKLIDIMGRTQLTVLPLTPLSKGTYKYDWNWDTTTNGLYFVVVNDQIRGKLWVQ